MHDSNFIICPTCDGLGCDAEELTCFECDGFTVICRFCSQSEQWCACPTEDDLDNEE